MYPSTFIPTTRLQFGGNRLRQPAVGPIKGFSQLVQSPTIILNRTDDGRGAVVCAERLGRWIDRNWNHALDLVILPSTYVLGVILIALAEIADQNGKVRLIPGDPDRTPFLVAGFVITAVGAIFGAARNRQNSLAASRLRAIEAQLGGAKRTALELSQLELADLFVRLGYFSNERISLFMPTKDGTALRLVARYAMTQHYLSAGRSQYPLDQGCLGCAWREGEGVALNLPDPEVQYEEWRQCLLDAWKIPVDVSARFHMRSRICIAFGIEPGLRPRQGVIVIESQVDALSSNNPNLNPDRLRRRLKEKERDKLIRLLEILEHLEE